MVIAIIAVLAALLLPALREARLRAFSITCMANVRGGHTVLSTFANDHGGVYPEANEHLPDYFNEPGWPYEESRRYKLDDYVSSHKILHCPYFSYSQVRLHGMRPEDHWIREWNRRDSGGPGRGYCHMNYMWMGNYGRRVLLYMNGELPWPESMDESAPDRSLITHRINLLPGYGGQFIGHASKHNLLGINRITEPEMETAGLVENPVGFADGHVIVRSPGEIKRRVFLGSRPGLLHY